MMKKCIYIVLPCYNEEAILASSAHRVLDVLDGLMTESERISPLSKILFVDDGSVDNTWNIIRQLHDENTVFCGIQLSKNKGHQTALFAGMKYAVTQGADCVITIDADLQQDVQAIPMFIDKYFEGNDIVYGVRDSRDTDGFLKKHTATAYYDLMNMFGCNLLKNSADYRLMSSRAIEALSEHKESNLFIRGLVPEIGFKSDIVYFHVSERTAGISKYTPRKMLSLALDGITSFTIRPIRFVLFSGVLTFIISIVMMILTLIDHFNGKTVPGWSTLTISLWFLGGIQLLSLGIIGEYVGRTYIEAKNRPRYFISSTTDIEDN